MMREREYASFPMELAQASMAGRVLKGYASVFDYPIDSGVPGWEQTEYVRHGAFTKTLAENPGRVQVLLNHGQDPVVGMKPLGVPSVMRQDHHGLYVEVPLDKTSYNDDIVVSLASGALRAMSISFEAIKESHSDDRRERYLEEVKLWEFGPVTFPANQAAVASLHALEWFAPRREPRDDEEEPQSRQSTAMASRLALSQYEAELVAVKARIDRL